MVVNQVISRKEIVMKKHITVEVCCGSVDDCLLAEKLGADRIELNHALGLVA